MDYIIDSFENNGCQVQLVHDTDPLNPYEEFDTVSKIYHWHRRYDLGKSIDRMDEQEMIEYLSDFGEKVLSISPVYIYDHSGITISTKPFSCPWDSGQVGWAVITENNAILVDYPYRDEEKLQAVIEAEVDQYDKYLTGQVYGYRVIRDGDCIDSCYGFYDIADARSDGEHAAIAS